MPGGVPVSSLPRLPKPVPPGRSEDLTPRRWPRSGDGHMEPRGMTLIRPAGVTRPPRPVLLLLDSRPRSAATPGGRRGWRSQRRPRGHRRRAAGPTPAASSLVARPEASPRPARGLRSRLASPPLSTTVLTGRARYARDRRARRRRRRALGLEARRSPRPCRRRQRGRARAADEPHRDDPWSSFSTRSPVARQLAASPACPPHRQGPRRPSRAWAVTGRGLAGATGRGEAKGAPPGGRSCRAGSSKR